MKKQNKYIGKSKAVFMVWSICMLLLAACGKKEPVLLENFSESSSEESITGETEVQLEQSITDKTEKQLEQENADCNSAVICYVHICGAVMKPGVYQLAATSRIYEAVAMAGGFREDACTDYLNQAELVADGEQIRIPTQAEAEEYKRQPIQQGNAKAIGEEKQTNDPVLVNINTADVNTLCTLPGIGSQRAASIITFREQNGGFSSIEEILQVEGIKSGIYSKLKDKITI